MLLINGSVSVTDEAEAEAIKRESLTLVYNTAHTATVVGTTVASR